MYEVDSLCTIFSALTGVSRQLIFERSNYTFVFYFLQLSAQGSETFGKATGKWLDAKFSQAGGQCGSDNRDPEILPMSPSEKSDGPAE